MPDYTYNGATPVVTNVSSNSDSAALAEWAVENANVDLATDTPGLTAVLHHKNQQISYIDEEPHSDHPRRARAARVFGDLDSLIDYSTKHDLGEGATSIYVGTGAVRLIINAHAHDFAGWEDHTGTLVLERTPLWDDMAGYDRKSLSQHDFAELCESLATGWQDPDQATMLEIAQTIEISGEREYKSSVRLKDGSQSLTYVDNANARAGSAGDLVVPTRVTMAVNIYQGLKSPSIITARLRTRMVQGSGVKFQLLFDKTAKEIELEARQAIKTTLQNSCPGVSVYIGQPKAS